MTKAFQHGLLCHTSLALAALLLAEGGLSAARAADTNALFTNGVVALRIEIPPEGMKVLRGYSQTFGQPRPERVDVKATVREGTRVYTNVAVHLKGSYTFQPVDGKPSFTLNFDKFAPGQLFHGLDKIHLNNSVQDPTYLHEAFAREVFNDAGVPAPRVGHARASLNGRDLGFYVVLEGANKRFLKRHFKSVKGNLYDGGSGGEITSTKLDVDSGENPEDRSDLKALLAAASERDPSTRFARLERVLDVDRFVTFAVLEVFFIHWDGYCMAPNNYRLFHDADRDKMVFMPHGMDQILGGNASSSVLTPAWKGAVAKALFSTGEGQRRYEERFRQILTNHFRADAVNAKVDRIADRIRPFVGDSLIDRIRRAGGIGDGLKSRIASRVRQVQAQLVSPPEESVAFGADGTLALSGWQFRNGTQGTSASRTTRDGGREILEIRGDGQGSSGSWRKTLLLGPGHYEFSGLGRVAGLPNDAPASGVILRISGERSLDGISAAANWTSLRYQFEVQGRNSVELICEYRGPSGSGSFDASTLKLKRVNGR